VYVPLGVRYDGVEVFFHMRGNGDRKDSTLQHSRFVPLQDPPSVITCQEG
jgi:hypothetical protein